MTMLTIRTRVLFFMLALMMGVASLYFEWGLGLQPCPLCIMQRVTAFLLLFVFFCWCWVNASRAHRICFYAALFFAVAGIYFSGRQLYITAFPHTLACGPDLNTLINYFPWQHTLHALFYGSGDCGEVTWRFLNMPMALWSLLLFCFFAFSLLLEAYLNKKIEKI